MLLAAMAGCGRSAAGEPAPDGILAEREARLEQALATPDSGVSDAPVARWLLPARLRELSGLALTADDRLFTHGDELGRIVEIDYRRGVIVKEFTVGSPMIRGDFEALTMIGDTLALLASDGVIYRFLEGADQAAVPYTRLDTGLGAQCAFEGMTFDSSASALVLICKAVKAKGLADSVVLYLWPVGQAAPGGAAPAPSLTIPLSAIIGTLGWKKVEPSDIAVNPENGNYRIVASGQKGLIEVTTAGEVVFSRALPDGHAQPEGLAMSRTNLMLVSDEATVGPAVLTVYRVPRGKAPQ